MSVSKRFLALVTGRDVPEQKNQVSGRRAIVQKARASLGLQTLQKPKPQS